MGIFDGKVAIVTGSGRGIGRAEALQLAAQGASVVVNDLGVSLQGGTLEARPADEVVAEIVAAGGRAVANFGDVGDWSGAKALVQQAIDTYGGLDILVNNAGVIRTGMSFNTEEADWDVVIHVHLKGTFAMCRFAGEYWRNRAKAEGGPVNASIVNTSSPNGLNGGVPGHVNYAAAKSGIATMTITLARELAPYGVRCNAVAPVAVTRMTEELWDTDLFPRESMAEKSPEGIAAVVAWLASDLASDVSGQVLQVHGRTCSLWQSWHIGAEVESPTGGPWTLDDAPQLRAQLFAGHDPGVPPVQ
ncbi:MAG: SDR family oxidoreductase [Actinomycetota bacterium]|nr:SDR family oxidoreductase [Actinomycetota bacterium]